jgi:hypothetical protein
MQLAIEAVVAAEALRWLCAGELIGQIDRLEVVAGGERSERVGVCRDRPVAIRPKRTLSEMAAML